MPSRLQKYRSSYNSRSRESSVPAKDSDSKSVTNEQPRHLPIAARYSLDSRRPNSSAMEEAKYKPYANSPKSNGKNPSTIRTVPSFDAPSDTSSDSPSVRNSGFSSSINSNASGASYLSQSQSQDGSTVRIEAPYRGSNMDVAGSQNGVSQVSSSGSTLKADNIAADDTSSLQVPGHNMLENQPPSAREDSPQWDGAVGKAALGKTGRVINKLVGDNEALKREIKLERMKAEESKQAARLMEDKMERMVAEYESRLLEANVTKTLLHRKERQVETLQSTIELEKKRTAEALERERTWKEELEKSKQDANVQVQEAQTQAALMEGRYNAIASHWKDQGDQVTRATAKVRAEITSLVEERKQDDEKINTLRDVCDQQDSNIKDLKRQKDEIGQKFEKYKKQQDEMLRDIKKQAAEREAEQEHSIEETKRILGELKWALNVKKNVAGAG